MESIEPHMGKLLSRAAAAAMLRCTPQTITNYVRYGLIDEIHRELNGRDGYYYDEDQLSALAPHLRDITELEGEIQRRREALLEDERALERARDEARSEFIRLAGGKKTWAKVRDLIVGAYAFAGKMKPSWESHFDACVLERILALEDFDTICASLKATPFRVNAAVSRIARRMLSMRNMQKEYEEIKEELRRVREDNRRLKEAYDFQRAVKGPVEELTQEQKALLESVKELLPLQEVKISSLGLSTRTQGILFIVGVDTLFDLVGRKEEDIAKVRNCGKKTMDELRELLSSRGLSFGMHDIDAMHLNNDYIGIVKTL